jgi:hypothetical protein
MNILSLGLNLNTEYNTFHVFPDNTGDGSARSSVGETNGTNQIFQSDTDFSGELETSDAVTVGMTVMFTNNTAGNNNYIIYNGGPSGTASNSSFRMSTHAVDGFKIYCDGSSAYVDKAFGGLDTSDIQNQDRWIRIIWGWDKDRDDGYITWAYDFVPEPETATASSGGSARAASTSEMATGGELICGGFQISPGPGVIASEPMKWGNVVIWEDLLPASDMREFMAGEDPATINADGLIHYYDFNGDGEDYGDDSSGRVGDADNTAINSASFTATP